MHVEGNLSPTFQLLLLCTAIVAGDEALCGERREEGRRKKQGEVENRGEKERRKKRGEMGERRKKGRREKKNRGVMGEGVGGGGGGERRGQCYQLSMIHMHTCARSSLERPLD